MKTKIKQFLINRLRSVRWKLEYWTDELEDRMPVEPCSDPLIERECQRLSGSIVKHYLNKSPWSVEELRGNMGEVTREIKKEPNDEKRT